MIDDRSLNHLKNRLVPYPNNVEFFDGEFFRIRNGCQVELAVPAGLESMVVNAFRNNWKMEPQITNYPANDGIKAEGYLLSVLVDSINETLYDTFLDSVLDDTLELMEDYIEDLKEMVAP